MAGKETRSEDMQEHMRDKTWLMAVARGSRRGLAATAERLLDLVVGALKTREGDG